MKKSFILLIALLLMLVTSCSSQTTYNIYLPDGTPALALANLLDQNDARYKINIVNPTQIASSVAANDCDMAIMPTISAATIYTKNKVEIKMISNNIFGSLYIASKSDIKDLSLLKGHVVYSTAGTTIDMLKYLFDKNSIKYNLSSEIKADEVSITTLSSASEIIPLLNKNSEALGVLGEPVLSQAMRKVDGLNIAIDIQEEYKKLNNNESYPQACFVAKKDMIEHHNKDLMEIISLLENNLSFVLANIDHISSIYDQYNSSLKNIQFDESLVNRCNLGFVLARNMKEQINSYVKELGNISLDDEFYY